MTSFPPPPDGSEPAHEPFPVGPEAVPRDIPQPPSIVSAVKLMWVGAALSLLTLVYTVVTIGSARDEIRESAAQSDPSISPEALDAAVAVGIGLAIVVSLIGVGLWVWMAKANGSGRSWARIVATVLGGLNVVFSLFSLASGGAAFTLILTLINVVLAAVILFLLWRKESSDFYLAHS